MKRVLFVDDDPQVLDGLRNMLRPQRKRWSMVFANGGQAALDEAAREPFDVVVSDMRMPGMDGATLLKKVAELYPRAVRIVLSGQTEMETALKSVSFAHQFLSKPCEAEFLQNVLERACELNSLLGNEPLRQLVGSVKRLPSTPSVFLQLTQELSNPNVSLKRVADLLGRDIAICARVIQLVNSPFFGLTRPISSVLEAVTYLGTTTIKSVVLQLESFSMLSQGVKIPGFSLDALQRHSMFTAALAKMVIGDSGRAEYAFMAGMLHDIGVLILATHIPEPLELMIGKPDQIRAEQATEVSHARIGAYLLGLWGLPYPVLEAVAHHHTPGQVDHKQFDLPDAVYVADHIAKQVLRNGDHGAEDSSELDVTYLESLGVDAAKLAAWRAAAEKLARDDSTVG